jgi:hypothetical protein
MKTIKILTAILALAVNGCGETNLMSAHASEQVTDVRCEYSGADREYKVQNGQVFEYGNATETRVAPKKMVVAKSDGQVHEYH